MTKTDQSQTTIEPEPPMSQIDYTKTVGRSWTSSIAKQTYTVLAWVDGFAGGALFVKIGPGVLDVRTGGGRNEQCWMTIKQWEAWIAASGAKPDVAG